jgi:hypothetical protein
MPQVASSTPQRRPYALTYHPARRLGRRAGGLASSSRGVADTVAAPIEQQIKGVEGLSGSPDVIEDDFPPFRLHFVHPFCQGDRAQGDLRTVLRPGHAGIGHVVTVAGQLHEDAQPGGCSCRGR